MYECFHCGSRSVIWDADFTFSDCGYDGDGLVHFCHCENCGAEIEYLIPFGKEEEGSSNTGPTENSLTS